MKRDYHDRGERTSIIKRRTVLKSVGALGVAGVIATEPVSGGGQGEATCDCPDGTVAWGKFEFDTEACEFVFEKGDNFDLNGGLLVEITDWESKEGEECEPVVVEYETANGYVVHQICSFGGNDVDVDDDPDGTYESDLENRGGQRAAISHITFCVAEDQRFPGYQIDLIYGDPIEQFDPANDVTYDDEDRLLQSYWSGAGLDTSDFHRNNGGYADCWDDIDTVDQGDAIPRYITLVNDGTEAIAEVKPDDADCLDDFALVSYGAPGDKWDPDVAPEQVLWDADTTGAVDENEGTVSFRVDVPPTE